jgi:hypothetical protein
LLHQIGSVVIGIDAIAIRPVSWRQIAVALIDRVNEGYGLLSTFNCMLVLQFKM